MGKKGKGMPTNLFLAVLVAVPFVPKQTNISFGEISLINERMKARHSATEGSVAGRRDGSSMFTPEWTRILVTSLITAGDTWPRYCDRS